MRMDSINTSPRNLSVRRFSQLSFELDFLTRVDFFVSFFSTVKKFSNISNKSGKSFFYDFTIQFFVFSIFTMILNITIHFKVLTLSEQKYHN